MQQEFHWMGISLAYARVGVRYTKRTRLTFRTLGDLWRAALMATIYSQAAAKIEVQTVEMLDLAYMVYVFPWYRDLCAFSGDCFGRGYDALAHSS
jgi:hypothetical protein